MFTLIISPQKTYNIIGRDNMEEEKRRTFKERPRRQDIYKPETHRPQKGVRPERLIPKDEQQAKEWREKAAQTRREKKQMKEELQLLLKMKSQDRSIKHECKRLNIPVPDVQTQILLNLIRLASTPSKQAVQAATFIRDTMGEKPVEKQVQLQSDLEKYLDLIEDNYEF